jgi:uncharacterized protein YjaZ
MALASWGLSFFQTMALNISILSSSLDLKPHAKRLRLISKSVERKVKKVLPEGEIDVVFYDNPEGTIKEIGGIGGFTPVANTVFISLNPRAKHFAQSLESELPYTLAHELHHAARFRTPIQKETLLEAMISEGLADHFALAVTKRGKPMVWCTALTSQQKKSVLVRAKKEWNLERYDHAAWFYGPTPVKIPRWAGYALGYDLVGKYLLSHPGVQIAHLLVAKAEMFVR